MREIRQSGSEGGALQTNAASLPLFQSLTFPGVDKPGKMRKPPSCEPLKVQEPGGFQWTTSRV